MPVTRRKVAKRKASRPKRNPVLAVLGNPGSRRGRRGATSGAVPIGKAVDRVFYVHETEGERVHEFGAGVRMEGLPDGSVRIYHSTRRVWDDL